MTLLYCWSEFESRQNLGSNLLLNAECFERRSFLNNTHAWLPLKLADENLNEPVVDLKYLLGNCAYPSVMNIY
jgi:hypothetical protein